MTVALVLAGAALAAVLPARASEATAPRHAPPARPYVLMIHGGSWYRVGARAVAGIAVNVPRLRTWGYVTELVRYRARRRAFPDVLAAYDRLRRRAGPQAPICAYGASAGAQMALMLAIRRPDVACVVSQAAPTELQRLPWGLRQRARAAFGRRLVRWSPASYRVLTPLLLEQATTDPIVPFAQMAAMHAVAPRSRTLALTPGADHWVHAYVSRRELALSYAAERHFLSTAIAQWRAHGPFGHALFQR